ncbi:MAG: hypothetical protein C4541_09675 [Candidatus Auribacter fodinae]|uniref:Uncharacterized protein n=1 Tax=Candidatus Auribacter fodinae TaxID=2093366 RepID=A0A3A4QUT0_9BACT|nr:MAG: hypothetical protein C4541_09675 [Candidatus Auribacter fodinae]
MTVTSLADNKTYTLMINKTHRPLMPQQMISYTSRIEGNPRLPDGEYSAEFNAYLEEAPDVKWSESLRFTIKDKDIQYPSDTE